MLHQTELGIKANLSNLDMWLCHSLILLRVAQILSPKHKYDFFITQEKLKLLMKLELEWYGTEAEKSKLARSTVLIPVNVWSNTVSLYKYLVINHESGF